MTVPPRPDTDKVPLDRLGLATALAEVALRALLWSLTGSVAVLVWLLEAVLGLVAAPIARLVLGSGDARQGEAVVLVRSGLALGAAVMVGVWAFLRIIYPWPVFVGWAALIALGLAIGLAAFEAWRRRAGSGLVGWLGELGPVLLVLIGMGSATWLGAPGLDAISGLVLAVALGWTAVEDARRGTAATAPPPQ